MYIALNIQYNSMEEKYLYWKKLAIERRLENKELKKRLKETKGSRENWKAKAIASKERSDALLRDLNVIKKKIEEILSHPENSATQDTAGSKLL